MDKSKYILISEAAEIIGCTTETVVNLLKRGALRGNDPTNMRRTYVDRESLETFCTAIPDAGKQIAEIESLKEEIKRTKQFLKEEQLRLRYEQKEWAPYAGRMLEIFSRWLLPENEAKILIRNFKGDPISKIADDMDLEELRCRQMAEKGLRMISTIPVHKFFCDTLEEYKKNHPGEIINSVFNRNYEEDDFEEVYDEDEG